MHYRLSFILFLFFSSVLNAVAQKLSNIQSIGVYITPNVKIDGKSEEWAGQFKAFNNAVNLSYTVANNEDDLYLIIQAKDPRVIEKILTVGLTFIVNTNGKKDEKDKENIFITFPLLKRFYTHGILVNAGDKANWSGVPARNKALFVETLTRTDSTVASANTTFAKFANTIKIGGLKNETDTLISIYNEQRIRVAAMFDNKGVYTYELAVPLKYYQLFDKQNFTYGIRLNNWGNPMDSFFSPVDPITRQLGDQQDADPDLNSTTFLWGEYTLAKKQ